MCLIISLFKFSSINAILKRKGKFSFITHSELNSRYLLLTIFMRVLLYTDSYSCKYGRVTYLMRLLRVDIAKGIEISLTVDLRNKFVCSFGIRTIIHQPELRAYTQVVLLKDKSSLSLVYFLNFDCNGQYIRVIRGLNLIGFSGYFNTFMGGGLMDDFLLKCMYQPGKWIGFFFLMVFNATFSNISAISWRPVLVVEEAGVPGENH